MTHILDCTPIAQFAIGLDHRIENWNKACEVLTGFRAEQMIGTDRHWEPFYPARRPVLADLIVENDFAHFKRLYRDKRALRSKVIPSAWQAMDFFENLGGKPRHVFFLAAPVFDAHGEIIGAVETLQDITEQVRAREDLRASEERYRILAEQTADGVALIQRGIIQFANNAFLTLFGELSPEEALGKRVVQFISGPYRKQYMDMERAFQRGEAKQETIQVKCIKLNNDAFWAEATNNGVNWEGEPALLVTIRDITESKEKEQRIMEEAFQLRSENIRLKSRMKDRYGLGPLIGRSHPMQEVYGQILKAASSDANVILYGESGTGKELAARAIHDISDRSAGTFVAVNCAAIPENLFESEFFGHKKGAFTGAHMDKIGYLESARNGTLFLDEVGDVPLNMQVKLLRAIEGGGFSPIGSPQVRKTDVRILSATNKDLKDLVGEGRMREDFFYRIHIIPITMPPLRTRKDDLALLVYHFLQIYNEDEKAGFIPDSVFQALERYDWPGNVRELQNVIQRYVAFGGIDFLGMAHDASGHPAAPFSDGEAGSRDLRGALEQYEKKLIYQSLERHANNRTRAAKSLGIERRSLQRKLKKYGDPSPRH
jgi:PAS domain S-box-containing protein